MLAKNLLKVVMAISVMGFYFHANAQCQISCPGNIIVNNSPGVCGTNVNFTVTAGNCPVALSQPSGSFFPVGTTTVNATATAPSGAQSTCSFTVTVNDNEAPRITNVSATPNTLWPPNHKMQDIMVNYQTTDNCPGQITCGLTVSSNEPVNDIGDGNTAPDWIVLDAHRVQLRAERAGPLNGRVYTITIGCRDQRNNSSTATTIVTVPHDQGNRKYSNMSIQVGPNPSRSNFNLNINSDNQNTKINLSITDLRGNVIEAKANINTRQNITVGNQLRPGTYIIKAQQGDSIVETQVVKQ